MIINYLKIISIKSYKMQEVIFVSSNFIRGKFILILEIKEYNV